MKKALNVTVDEDVLAEVKKRKGLRSMSSAVQHFLEKALRDQDLTFIPPSLKSARVSHLAGRNPETKVEYLEGSVVRPAQDAPDGPAPYTIYHDREFGGRADKSTPGNHWFDPSRCGNCRILLKDFPR